MKIVVNRNYGGFGISHKGLMKYAELKGIKLYAYKDYYNHAFNTNLVLLTDEEAISERAATIYYSTSILHTVEDLNADSGYLNERDIARNDPALVQAVEQLGTEANARYADLEVVEIPDDVDWQIDEYDGWESIHEKHRSW